MDMQKIHQLSVNLLNANKAAFNHDILGLDNKGDKVHLFSELFIKLSGEHMVTFTKPADGDLYYGELQYEGVTYCAWLRKQQFEENFNVLGGEELERIATA
ncbi:hypothetical protein [Ectobacillus ponti]|uniref:Uncharacterized protein n=1 Tax=Ectobacillus ponti TaxID=2961894 RepID=A0AA41XB93_9BACI|nr:hypothetical protein [Ectobacillus ponti]MCP8969698.1 hypothetical protein [Ectobacillus ponti]